jgi:hypothetical protein
MGEAGSEHDPITRICLSWPIGSLTCTSREQPSADGSVIVPRSLERAYR